jgi:hypothetical protein
MSRKGFSRPSLTQHFDAPALYRGSFGWICGFSADAKFLNDAAERFTRATTAQRAYEGRVSLALMLDPGNPQISMMDVPGVAHLGMLPATEKPFQLLHAKVALLGFRHEEDADQWLLRLIVSTGNWTAQTIEDSLDLAWCVDLLGKELDARDEDLRSRCADIDAAWSMLSYVVDRCDTSILAIAADGIAGETSAASERVRAWLHRCREARGHAKSRFFDNREKSLLEQLPAMVKRSAASVSRNYLALGSGFYETTTLPGHPPSVLVKIRNALKERGLLTQTPEIDVFVSNSGSQSVAQFAAEQAMDDTDKPMDLDHAGGLLKALTSGGFTLRPAGQPNELFGKAAHRVLHAKFAFSANQREGSNNCSSPWLYLGSGNLTGPGFIQRMRKSGGNLEAGVVFEPRGLYWYEEKGVASEQVVTNLLPLQWEEEMQCDHLIVGAGMPERNDRFVAPPVAYVTWQLQPSGSGVLVSPIPAPDFDILDLQGDPCPKLHDRFDWPERQPRQIVVRWRLEGIVSQAQVPVVDEFGRLAATPLPKLGLFEAWWQLSSFPLPPEVDDPDSPSDEDSEGIGNRQSTVGHAAGGAEYPVRQMMEMIENIAARQTLLSEADWPSWCNRLQQVLTQASESDVVQMFVALRLNPLQALCAVPFRPSFAETSQTEAGALYERTLLAIEKSWDVADLPCIGVLP